MPDLRPRPEPPVSSAASRPAPWAPPAAGFHFEVVPAGDDWITPPLGTSSCRFTSGHPLVTCGEPAVATLLRGRTKQAWNYCAEHLYGRWVEDGRVVAWRMVPDE